MLLLRPSSDSVHDATADRRIQPREIAGSRIQYADLVHDLFQPRLSNHVIESLTVLPGCNTFSLAQECIPYISAYFQTLVRISQHLQQCPFNRRLHHGLKHLPEL
jgi:hypothetical protein